MKPGPGADVRFRKIYDNNFEAMRSYCLRRVPVSDVNDVLSDLFLFPSGETSESASLRARCLEASRLFAVVSRLYETQGHHQRSVVFEGPDWTESDSLACEYRLWEGEDVVAVCGTRPF